MPAPGETEPPTADGWVVGDSPALQDEQCQESIDVEVGSTHVGHGVFATRSFPVNAVIGEIDGVIVDDPDHGSDYAFDIGDDLSLEPDPPFRFLNHSCEPNCEYVWADEEGEVDIRQARRLYVVALRNITQGEQLTIDYCWEADAAIPCLCGSPKCRGWIVCEEEAAILIQAESGDRRRRA